MVNNEFHPKVEGFLSKAKTWKEEYEKLRSIILQCDLEEDFKWMHPCYTLNGKNVVLIHGFKEYCAILFIKGSLLKDPNKVLIQQTENVQAGRQIRFKNVQEIIEIESIIIEYIEQAKEIEKAGLVVEFNKDTEFNIPEELQSKFDENTEFKAAFEALTPGRQRAYIFHFSQAKQAKTRIARIEKNMENIFAGKGLNER